MTHRSCCHQHPPAHRSKTPLQAAKEDLEYHLGYAIGGLILSSAFAAILWFALAAGSEHAGPAFIIHAIIAALMTTLAMLALAAIPASIDEYEQTVKRITDGTQHS